MTPAAFCRSLSVSSSGTTRTLSCSWLNSLPASPATCKHVRHGML